MFFSISANSTGTSATSSCSSSMYTKGVLQTIGFKEFIPYLEQFDAANDQKIEAYLQANAYKMPTEGNIIFPFFSSLHFTLLFFFLYLLFTQKKNSISCVFERYSYRQMNIIFSIHTFIYTYIYTVFICMLLKYCILNNLQM